MNVFSKQLALLGAWALLAVTIFLAQRYPIFYLGTAGAAYLIISILLSKTKR